MTAPEPTFPDRMRLAADIIDDVNTRLGGPINGHWRPSELRGEADQVEAEEREAALQADQVEVLAREMTNITANSLEHNRATAEILVKLGWRKGDAS